MNALGNGYDAIGAAQFTRRAAGRAPVRFLLALLPSLNGNLRLRCP
jgi:hypothetical protein